MTLEEILKQEGPGTLVYHLRTRKIIGTLWFKTVYASYVFETPGGRVVEYPKGDGDSYFPAVLKQVEVIELLDEEKKIFKRIDNGVEV